MKNKRSPLKRQYISTKVNIAL